MGQAQPCTSHSAIPPFGGALDMGRARPCASHGAIPPVWWRPRRGPSSTVHLSQRKSPFGGGPRVALVGVAPKVQTTSAKNADNRVLWARWSAIWAQRRLASRGARKEPLNMRVNAFDTHVNLSKCAWAALPTRKSSGPRADQRAHVRVSGPACARVHSSPAPVQG